MQYQKESSIICFGDTKQAALYFDGVFPVSLIFKELFFLPPCQSYIKNRLDRNLNKKEQSFDLEKIMKEISTNDSALIIISIFENLLGEYRHKIDDNLLEKTFESLFSYMSLVVLTMRSYDNNNRLNKFPKTAIDKYKYMYELNKLGLNLNNFRSTLESMLDLLCLFYAEDVKIDNLSEKIRRYFNVLSRKWTGKDSQVLLPSFSITNKEATERDISLTLSNINLIDTSKVKWEQIIEYRKDVEAKKKIRNLRLFLHTNYQGKSLAFIEDDLGKRLDEYYNTCKDWGFETLASTISVIMDSENLVPLIAGSSSATLFGGPVAGLAVGGGILLANISLNITKRKHAFNKFKRDHELAYIIEAKKRFEKTSKP